MAKFTNGTFAAVRFGHSAAETASNTAAAAAIASQIG